MSEDLYRQEAQRIYDRLKNGEAVDYSDIGNVLGKYLNEILAENGETLHIYGEGNQSVVRLEEDPDFRSAPDNSSQHVSDPRLDKFFDRDLKGYIFTEEDHALLKQISESDPLSTNKLMSKYISENKDALSVSDMSWQEEFDFGVYITERRSQAYRDGDREASADIDAEEQAFKDKQDLGRDVAATVVKYATNDMKQDFAQDHPGSAGMAQAQFNLRDMDERTPQPKIEYRL